MGANDGSPGSAGTPAGANVALSPTESPRAELGAADPRSTGRPAPLPKPKERALKGGPPWLLRGAERGNNF